MRDLIAVGASAGGVEALKQLVSGLPEDLPATVLVGLHLSQERPSVLPSLLQRQTGLEVLPAEDGLELAPGRVVVSAPGHHLLVVEDRVVLGRGGRENSQRPSHDAMMRSAALLRRERAIGVVLTGLLDDGSAGLEVIRRYGGACLVQDPSSSAHRDMPANALRAVPDALTVPLPELAAELARLVREDAPSVVVSEQQLALDRMELASALGDPFGVPGEDPPGDPSSFACPDCHGVLSVMPDTELLRFRCRTGHAWTADSLAVEQDASVEEALWTAVRALEERAELGRRLAERAGRPSWEGGAPLYAQRRKEAEAAAATLRDLLLRLAHREPTARGRPEPEGSLDDREVSPGRDG